MNREEIIKWLESLKAEMGKSEHGVLWHYAEVIDMAVKALQDRPTGKWIQPSGVLTVICSQCHHINNSSKWNFCPNCGADMRKEEE